MKAQIRGCSLPIGPKYPMNRASFQLAQARGINLYPSITAGMRRTPKTRNPNASSRPTVIPVSSGMWKWLHGIAAPKNMNAAKLSNVSIVELNVSWRAWVSALYSPSQLRTLPATKEARDSSEPKQPHVPVINIYRSQFCIPPLTLLGHTYPDCRWHNGETLIVDPFPASSVMYTVGMLGEGGRIQLTSSTPQLEPSDK